MLERKVVSVPRFGAVALDLLKDANAVVPKSDIMLVQIMFMVEEEIGFL